MAPAQVPGSCAEVRIVASSDTFPVV
jgi:hypothetical protein